MTVTLTEQDEVTRRAAAYGAVTLMSSAGGLPHKVATDGNIALPPRPAWSGTCSPRSHRARS